MVNRLLIQATIICVFFALALNSCNRQEHLSSNREYYYDSVFIAYTVKEYSKNNWYWYNSSKMSHIANDEIDFFVDTIFYSPDRENLIVWVGEKMYNAPTMEEYSKNDTVNKLCPFGGDTIYHFTVLAGYKDSSGLLKLYPWGNRQAPCNRTIDVGVKALEKYYLEDIKSDYFEVVGQQGKAKGLVRNQVYKYAISDKAFWSTSLWQRDSIGADNLYPFEVRYNRILTDSCVKCADRIELPGIQYPDSITNYLRK